MSIKSGQQFSQQPNSAGDYRGQIMMRMAHFDARDIKQALDLVAVAGRYTRLRRAGRQFVGLCPVHQERHPSFYVDSLRWYCFGCGRGGDVFAFLMAVEGCDFPMALRIAGTFLEPQGVASSSEPRSGSRFAAREGGEAPSCRRSRQALIARPSKALWEEHWPRVEEGARRALEARNAELPPCMHADLGLAATPLLEQER